MNKIISKEQFSEKVFKIEVEAPLIAKSRKAGHFVIVRVGEKGERMPLTIAEADPVKGTITLVVQKVGLSSTRLCELNVATSHRYRGTARTSYAHRTLRNGSMCRRWCRRRSHAPHYPGIEGSRKPCHLRVGRT